MVGSSTGSSLAAPVSSSSRRTGGASTRMRNVQPSVAESAWAPEDVPEREAVHEDHLAQVEHHPLTRLPVRLQASHQRQDRRDVELARLGQDDGAHAAISSGSLDSLRSPSRTRLFAVPSGMPSTAASSRVDRPPQ